MKKLLLIACVVIPLFANETDLELRLKSLESQILQLKVQANNNSEDLDEYIPIVEKVETKSILDVLSFTPELELRMNKMNYKLGNIEGETKPKRQNYNKNFAPALTARFNLSMDAKIDDKVNFHGRMLFVHSSESNQRLCILSKDIKSSSSTTGMEFDRAYVDYTPNKGSKYEFTFSFGILPTTGGTPMNFAKNTPRKSMFPALVFDMNSYGLIGTQKLAEDTFLRAIFAKGYTLNPNMFPYQCNRENIDNANIAGLYFDTKLGFLGQSLLSFGVNYIGDLKAHPYLGPNISATNSKILGNMITYGLGLDAQNILGSGITLFTHLASSHPSGNGAKESYPSFSTAPYARGTMLQENGYAYYVGTKIEIAQSFNLGLEYNHGSKYWFAATQGATDVFNKLATRGNVTEIYSTWKFYKSMQLKLGYMHTNENYTGSGWHFGEPAAKDGKQDITYLSLKASF